MERGCGVKYVGAAVTDYGIKASTAGLDYLPELRKIFYKITAKARSLPVFPTPLVS